jgi:DNA-binding MarR family transcriptional regulator
MSMTLKPQPRRLLDWLAAHPNGTSASNTKIADVLNCAPRTVSRYLANLEASGHITIERRSPNSAGVGTDPTGRTIRLTDCRSTNDNSQDF